MKSRSFNLVLGTAQLDKKYSLSKDGLSEKNFKKIILLSKKEKNFFIDTALGYKNSEEVLSKIDLKKFNIITKIDSSKKNVIEALIKSKKKLNIKKFYGVLFHNEKQLLGKSSKEYLTLVKSLKDNNITNKVGVSVYTLKSLNLIIKKFNINLIQIPANVFDKRFLNKKLLKKLKEKNISIFVRSVFLKGILINKKFRDKNKFFDKYKKEFNFYERWLEKKNIINKNFFCINYILANKIKNIVIGFDNFDEYKEIANFQREKYVYPPNFVKPQNDRNKLLRPDLW
jgi:aryl-alcohol dehydrogenase-like predicted oxidoreductase